MTSRSRVGLCRLLPNKSRCCNLSQHKHGCCPLRGSWAFCIGLHGKPSSPYRHFHNCRSGPSRAACRCKLRYNRFFRRGRRIVCFGRFFRHYRHCCRLRSAHPKSVRYIRFRNRLGLLSKHTDLTHRFWCQHRHFRNFRNVGWRTMRRPVSITKDSVGASATPPVHNAANRGCAAPQWAADVCVSTQLFVQKPFLGALTCTAVANLPVCAGISALPQWVTETVFGAIPLQSSFSDRQRIVCFGRFFRQYRHCCRLRSAHPKSVRYIRFRNALVVGKHTDPTHRFWCQRRFGRILRNDLCCWWCSRSYSRKRSLLGGIDMCCCCRSFRLCRLARILRNDLCFLWC